jgi:SAM-dependent methyltransferase
MGVIWHELECGSYTADLALWRELAAERTGAVLDVGAGAGRVALHLARAGHEVVALDLDLALLSVIDGHSQGLRLTTVRADARHFQLERRFELILVPMQTIQLLGGAGGRELFLARARAHLSAGGLLAIAVAEQIEPFDADDGIVLVPDMVERDGIVYSSRPVRVRAEPQGYVLERMREVVSADGARSTSADSVTLDLLTAAELEGEAAALGLRVGPRHPIAATAEHVGSTVVMLGG